MNIHGVWTLVAITALCVACGPAEVGEECAKPRAEGECVEEAVCVQDDQGAILCRKLSAIGEVCSSEGDQAECSGNAICGKDTTGGIECLQVCSAKEDCPSDQDCNGVEGTDVKGCRLK